MLRKSSLALIVIVIGLSVIGMLFTLAEGDFNSCVAPASSQVFLRVYSSGSANQPVGGARVSGTIEWECPADNAPGYIVQFSSIPMQTTPPNGTIILGSISGNYSVTVAYLGHQYSLNFGPVAAQPTVVTMGLPNGQYAVAACSADSNPSCPTSS